MFTLGHTCVVVMGGSIPTCFKDACSTLRPSETSVVCHSYTRYVLTRVVMCSQYAVTYRTNSLALAQVLGLAGLPADADWRSIVLDTASVSRVS